MPKKTSFLILTLSSLEEGALSIKDFNSKLRLRRIPRVCGRESHEINICIINGKIVASLKTY